MKQLTEQEQKILIAGEAAQALLNNPDIASAINELSESLANSILNTPPEDSKKREVLYNVHFGLRELVGILNQRVQLKQNIEAQMVEEENE